MQAGKGGFRCGAGRLLELFKTYGGSAGRGSLRRPRLPRVGPAGCWHSSFLPRHDQSCSSRQACTGDAATKCSVKNHTCKFIRTLDIGDEDVVAAVIAGFVDFRSCRPRTHDDHLVRLCQATDLNCRRFAPARRSWNLRDFCNVRSHRQRNAAEQLDALSRMSTSKPCPS